VTGSVAAVEPVADQRAVGERAQRVAADPGLVEAEQHDPRRRRTDHVQTGDQDRGLDRRARHHLAVEHVEGAGVEPAHVPREDEPARVVDGDDVVDDLVGERPHAVVHAPVGADLSPPDAGPAEREDRAVGRERQAFDPARGGEGEPRAEQERRADLGER
jgi:hypothetical protein